MIAWAHAIGLRSMIEARILDAKITAVYDIDPQRAAGLADASRARTARSLTEAIEQCDALWVCTPTACHYEAVEEAAQRGRAVFCEKPLATTLAGAEALAQTVADSGVAAQVGLVLRSTPVFRALRALTESGDLGRPMVAVFRDDQYFPIQGLYASTWRSDSKVAGGGCLIEHSIHDVDILRFCLGEVTKVACRTSNISGMGDVEDVATVSLDFASGATASLTSVWHDITNRGSSRRVELFFERAMVWLDKDFLGPLHVQSAPGVEVVRCPSPQWVDELPLAHDEMGLAVRMYVEADRAFADAVCDGRQPEPSLVDAVVAHRIVDAAYRSAAMNGTPLPLR